MQWSKKWIILTACVLWNRLILFLEIVVFLKQLKIRRGTWTFKNTAGNFIWPSEYYKNEKAFIFRLWRIIWHLLLREKMLFTLSRNLSTMIYLMGLWHNNLLYTGFITKFLMLPILSFKMKEQLCNEKIHNNVMEYLFQNKFHSLINLIHRLSKLFII